MENEIVTFNYEDDLDMGFNVEAFLDVKNDTDYKNVNNKTDDKENIKIEEEEEIRIKDLQDKNDKKDINADNKSKSDQNKKTEKNSIDSSSEEDHLFNDEDLNDIKDKNIIIKNNDNNNNNKDNSKNDEEKNKNNELLTFNNALSFLKEPGIVSLPEDINLEEAEPHEIYEHIIKDYQKKAFDAVLSKVDDSLKDVVKYALNGGNDVNKLIDIMSSPEEVDIDNAKDEIAYKLFLQKTTKWDNTRIDKYISSLDEDIIKDDIPEIKDKLKVIFKEEKEAEHQRVIMIQKEKEKQMNDWISEMKESIKETNFIDESRKTTLKNFILNPVNKQGEWNTDFSRTLKKIQSNKNHLLQLADLLMDYDEKKGLTYERITKKDNTKLTQALKNQIEKNVVEKLDKKVNDWTHLF